MKYTYRVYKKALDRLVDNVQLTGRERRDDASLLYELIDESKKVKEITKRVYYGDIDPHRREDHYVVWEEALYRIRKHFGNELYNFILIKEGTDEYGADYMEGILKIIIPDTYKPKDFYIP